MKLIKWMGNKFSAVKLATVALLASAFAAGSAMAQTTDLGTQAATSISGAGPQVTAVIVALLAVLVLLVVWQLIRKAMGK